MNEQADLIPPTTTAAAAQTWLDKNRKRWPEGAHVRLVGELG